MPTDNSTWTKLTTWAFHGYNLTITGSNSSCSGNNSQSAWIKHEIMWTHYLLHYQLQMESWTRFTISWSRRGFYWSRKILGYSGFFCLDRKPIVLVVVLQQEIFSAEKNVYAGSNVLSGDLAEYF